MFQCYFKLISSVDFVNKTIYVRYEMNKWTQSFRLIKRMTFRIWSVVHLSKDKLVQFLLCFIELLFSYFHAPLNLKSFFHDSLNHKSFFHVSLNRENFMYVSLNHKFLLCFMSSLLSFLYVPLNRKSFFHVSLNPKSRCDPIRNLIWEFLERAQWLFDISLHRKTSFKIPSCFLIQNCIFDAITVSNCGRQYLSIHLRLNNNYERIIGIKKANSSSKCNPIICFMNTINY